MIIVLVVRFPTTLSHETYLMPPKLRHWCVLGTRSATLNAAAVGTQLGRPRTLKRETTCRFGGLVWKPRSMSLTSEMGLQATLHKNFLSKLPNSRFRIAFDDPLARNASPSKLTCPHNFEVATVVWRGSSSK